MDGLGGFLQGSRARGAFLLRSIMDPPWSLRIQDRAPLTMMAVVRGSAWVMPTGADSCLLGPGDVALIRGPAPYTVADDPGTAPQLVIHPGQHCTTPAGVRLTDELTLGVRTWGNDPDGSAMLLTGTYATGGEVSERVLAALPTLAVLRGADWDSPFITLLTDEIVKDEPGQEAVLDRLLDLLLIAALRAWFSRAGSQAPAWYRAHSDPVVGTALRMLHEHPAHQWTVAELAHRVGVSRAALARRFTDLVGEPPMAFLTSWRLALAADLLREPEATVGAVARQVGYSSPFTFSTAFKRVHGISPTMHRNAARSAAEAGADDGSEGAGHMALSARSTTPPAAELACASVRNSSV